MIGSREAECLSADVDSVGHKADHPYDNPDISHGLYPCATTGNRAVDARGPTVENR
jgi:hypothetical protein